MNDDCPLPPVASTCHSGMRPPRNARRAAAPRPHADADRRERQDREADEAFALGFRKSGHRRRPAGASRRDRAERVRVGREHRDLLLAIERRAARLLTDAEGTGARTARSGARSRPPRPPAFAHMRRIGDPTALHHLVQRSRPRRTAQRTTCSSRTRGSASRARRAAGERTRATGHEESPETQERERHPVAREHLQMRETVRAGTARTRMPDPPERRAGGLPVRSRTSRYIASPDSANVAMNSRL